MEVEELEKRKSRKITSSSPSSPSSALINNLDDGCLMHIFSFLSPIPDRYNTALVCHRWCYLACHPRLWLRVDRSVQDFSEPGVFPNIEEAVSAARPGDTILIAAGGSHLASNIQIKKPLCLISQRGCLLIMVMGVKPEVGHTCLRHISVSDINTQNRNNIGGGELPDETNVICLRGSDSALEFLSTCKLTNLTVKAELGCCLLHRSGRLIIDECILQCESNPLDYLSCPIVSTAGSGVFPSNLKSDGDSISVSHTRIEGGAKAVLTSGDLALQQVRVIYARTCLYFWFDVDCR
ncbi:F-box protein SKIP5 isoform X2 [Gossypium hirsutum]|uniref:F-box protein SKIP5 isoform X2 n=1 Tax=Gossypium hirsutum TaxID=3635 RepID=A0A1U8MMI6_GOSHI|nr:F-box protein SKIP5 isoform X2 [Gossypium hirsutum]